MPISHTRTHMHCNTRRETLTQTQQTYRIFHCAYVFEGWWAVAMLYWCVSLYILWRGPNRYSKDWRHRRRCRPSTSNSIDTMSSEHIGKVLRARCLGQPSFPPPKSMWKQLCREHKFSCLVSGRREREREKVVPQQRGKMVEKPTESRENSGTFSTRKTLSVTLPNHMFCIPSKTLRLQIPSPPQPQLELPGFLRFVYS